VLLSAGEKITPKICIPLKTSEKALSSKLVRSYQSKVHYLRWVEYIALCYVFSCFLFSPFPSPANVHAMLNHAGKAQ